MSAGLEVVESQAGECEGWAPMGNPLPGNREIVWIGPGERAR
jgi:hypothetical protein